MDEFEWGDEAPADPEVMEAELRRLNHAPPTWETHLQMIRLVDDLGLTRARRVIAEVLGVRAGA